MKFFDEAKELLDLLSRASDSYYNYDESIIPDSEYDQKKDRLKHLYERILLPKKNIDPALVKEVEEFLIQIGAPVAPSEWKKATHQYPMFSLNKANFESEFLSWVKNIGDTHYVIFDKMDGGSIDLRYEQGDLTQAITRGDGTEGEDMLPNVLKMQNVKKHLPGFTGNLYGEVFISRDDFETLNLISTRKVEYKNPRNTATGLQKTLTGENVELLSILFYDIKGTDATTEEGKLLAIEAFGLKTCFWKKVTVEEAIKIYYEYDKTIRATLPYDIDGLVIRANSIALQEQHGMLGGNPKAKLAWKFPPMQRETKLLDVIWHVGNSRRITPIALLQPTPMGGVTVRRCSLHNVSFFKALNLRKGCTVLVERANDVIPYLVENRGGGGDLFEVPTTCPECGGQAIVEDKIVEGKTEQSKFLTCTNDDCSGLATGNLERWIQVLNIDSVGPKIILMLFQKGLVKEPADFYKLTKDQVAALDRMGERSATKVITNLRAKMQLTLPELIAGLNMQNFSTETAQTLVDAGYDSIVKIFNAQESELVAIKGIGDITASQIVKGIRAKATILKDLFDVGITIKEPEKIVTASNKLEGMSFCFTGAIQAIKPDGKRYAREDMHKLVVVNGGTVEESVKKGLTYLVMADPDSTSAKAQKARSLGTSVLGEKDFFQMIQD